MLSRDGNGVSDTMEFLFFFVNGREKSSEKIGRECLIFINKFPIVGVEIRMGSILVYLSLGYIVCVN